MVAVPQICIIGAGFSGLCAAIQLKEQLGIDSYRIFERHEDVGGTWLVNTYPGSQCDVPSHLYSFSFEPNPNWSSAYAFQPQILEYMRNVSKKHDIYPRIEFRTMVKVLKWEEDLSKWRVTVSKESASQELLFDFVINGCGHLTTPNIPKEFLAFQGELMHSAEWDGEANLEGKTVAVVGSGASAIQIIPTIAPIVKKLHVFHRKPAWILPKPDWAFPGWLKSMFSSVPLLMWIFRLAAFCGYESLCLQFVHDSNVQRFGNWFSGNLRNFYLRGKPGLNLKATPGYIFGCKRVLLANDYYPALRRDNVTVCADPTTEVKGRSIKTENETYEDIDVLVLATGFKAQDYFFPMVIIGRDGLNLLEFWKVHGPSMYYGVVCKEAPNFFTLAGPSSYLANNSVIFQIECQTNLIIRIVKGVLAQGLKSVCIKPEVEAEYMKMVKKSMDLKVWGNSECGSWYANSKGEVTSVWPETCTSFWLKLRRVGLEQFEIR